MRRYAIAVDLGGTNVRAAAVDEEGRVLFRLKRPSRAREGRAAVLENLASAIEEVRSACPGEGLCGVGLGIAGAIDVRRGVVAQSPNIPDWRDYPLREELAPLLGRIPLVLENDANAAALGERWRGAARGVEHLVCLTLGTGVGGGIIADGRVIHGADGMAGELGHITVDPEGPPCGCGNRGCLEAWASATAIKREAARAVVERPEGELARRAGGDPDAVTPELVLRCAEDGDPVCQEIYRRMGRYLGIGVASLINVFNPEMVVIGGGLSAAWEAFAPALREEVRRRAFRIPARRARIVRAACGDDAGLLGAAYLVLHLDRRAWGEETGPTR